MEAVRTILRRRSSSNGEMENGKSTDKPLQLYVMVFRYIIVATNH